MTGDQARRKMKAGEVAWIGIMIKACEDCGENIEWAHIVPIKTPEELAKSHGFIGRGKK